MTDCILVTPRSELVGDAGFLNLDFRKYMALLERLMERKCKVCHKKPHQVFLNLAVCVWSDRGKSDVFLSGSERCEPAGAFGSPCDLLRLGLVRSLGFVDPAVLLRSKDGAGIISKTNLPGAFSKQLY